LSADKGGAERAGGGGGDGDAGGAAGTGAGGGEGGGAGGFGSSLTYSQYPTVKGHVKGHGAQPVASVGSRGSSGTYLAMATSGHAEAHFHDVRSRRVENFFCLQDTLKEKLKSILRANLEAKGLSILLDVT
jgi:hypothetical protein